jgi:hypothetical protein
MLNFSIEFSVVIALVCDKIDPKLNKITCDLVKIVM